MTTAFLSTPAGSNFALNSLRWGDSADVGAKATAATVTVSLAGLDANTATLARQAMAEWSKYANINFSEVAAGKGQINIAYGAIDGKAGVLAQMTPTFDLTGASYQMKRADITVDSAEGYALNTATGKTVAATDAGSNLLTVFEHEIGHAIGLSHYNGSNAIMNNSIDLATSAVGLTASEIQGIQYLYGARSGAPTFDAKTGQPAGVSSTAVAAAVQSQAAKAGLIDGIVAGADLSGQDHPGKVNLHTVQVFFNAETGAHQFSLDGRQSTVANKSLLSDEGVLFRSPDAGTPGTVTVYSLYNSVTKQSYFTSDVNDYNAHAKDGFAKQGPIMSLWTKPDTGHDVPVSILSDGTKLYAAHVAKGTPTPSNPATANQKTVADADVSNDGEADGLVAAGTQDDGHDHDHGHHDGVAHSLHASTSNQSHDVNIHVYHHFDAEPSFQFGGCAGFHAHEAAPVQAAGHGDSFNFAFGVFNHANPPAPAVHIHDDSMHFSAAPAHGADNALSGGYSGQGITMYLGHGETVHLSAEVVAKFLTPGTDAYSAPVDHQPVAHHHHHDWMV